MSRSGRASFPVSPGSRSTDVRSRKRYDVCMRCAQGGGLDAAARARHERRRTRKPHRCALIVLPAAAVRDHGHQRAIRRPQRRGVLGGMDRRSPFQDDRARHACRIVAFGTVACRAVPGSATACQRGSGTDRHSADRRGRTDTLRTVADAGGHDPARELTRRQGMLRLHQEDCLRSSPLMTKSAHRGPICTIRGGRPVTCGAERMASGPPPDNPTPVGTI
jgi:hypothetical protein